MEFTGERYCPHIVGEIALEHYLRYAVAVSLAKGRDVLDCASGEGYGSALLARTARSVIGVDVSSEALDHARTTYARANLAFCEGTAAALPLPDASVDLVVSFETIEHHDQQAEMLAEFRRVLRPDGLLLLSSPDKAQNEDVHGLNPFHVRELYRQELQELLAVEFRNCEFYDQKTLFASVICPQQPLAIACWNSKTLNEELLLPAAHLPAACYVIALASNAAAPLPTLPLALLEGNALDAWAVCAQAEEAQRKLEALQRENEKILQQKTAADVMLATVCTSTSWKITAPLRRIGAWWRRLCQHHSASEGDTATLHN